MVLSQCGWQLAALRGRRVWRCRGCAVLQQHWIAPFRRQSLCCTARQPCAPQRCRHWRVVRSRRRRAGVVCTCVAAARATRHPWPRALLPLQSFFGFGGTPKVELELSDVSERKMRKVEMVDGPPQHLFIFEGKEVIRGRVRVSVPAGKKFEHLGIKVELKGTIGKSVLQE